MAKMMKKWMALVIALSLITNMVPLSAAAAENTESDVQTVTVDLTNDNGEKIGEKTTTTTTETKETPKNYTENVKEESSWTSQDTSSSTAEPVKDGNTTTEVSSTVVTDVSGQETSHDNSSTDKITGTQTLSGDSSGSETTTVTDTTTTVTTTTEEQLSFQQEGPTTTISNQVENGEWSDLEQTEEGSWEKTDEVDGTYVADEEASSTNHGTTDIDVDKDPLEDQDATLTMTQKNPTDSEKLFIPIDDLMSNELGDILEDGSVVSVKTDEDGNVIGYVLTKTQDTTPAGSNTGTITTDSTGDMTPAGKEVTTYIQPEGYTAGTQDALDGEGNVIGTITTEPIYDENNNIIGYNITKVTSGSTGNLPEATTQDLPAPADTWTLPEKPTPMNPTEQNGLTTTQTVEEIYENGVLVGYETITLVTDEDGSEQSRESVKIYGTKTTHSSTMQTIPESDEVITTTVTTVYGTKTTQNYTQTSTGHSTNVNTRVLTEDTYELVQTEEGLFMLVEGKVYQVTATGDHGSVSMTSLQPDLSIDPSKHGQISTSTDLRGAENFNVTGSLKDNYDVQYVGYGLESRIKVLESDGSSTLPHQFVLKDANGKLHYVYCVDLNTSAIRGTSYNMVNVKDSGYFKSESVAKKIEAIAITGFWGTDSGTGSLENLKQYMRNNKSLHNLSDAEINAITEGMALTATQAALWEYGHSVQADQLGSNVTGPVYNSSSSIYSTRSPDSEEKKLVNAIFSALININNTNMDTSTELLNPDNFATETTLVIKEKAKNHDGTVKTSKDAKGNDHEVYVTDVRFTVDVKESDLTGNLVVTVSDDTGKTLATRQLATDNSNFVGKMLTKYSVNDDNVEFLIEDLELPEGTKINLNLSGAQNLKEGAYLYTAEVYSTSQTFISVASGTREVDLNVKMQFDVTDPEASYTHTSKTWSETDTDTTFYKKTDQYRKERTGTVTSQNVTVTTEITGTRIRTDTEIKTTESERSWFDSYYYELTTTDGDGGDKTKETDDQEIILDEEVPLASAPKTGDLSLVWLLMAMICLAGAAMLSRKETLR